MPRRCLGKRGTGGVFGGCAGSGLPVLPGVGFFFCLSGGFCAAGGLALSCGVESSACVVTDDGAADGSCAAAHVDHKTMAESAAALNTLTICTPTQ
jgi:hypothetical protein